ncbi:hypothetical protein [Methanobrevibacter sp.]|uniref:hypothetical protein n=1 Tax=Methanobrevibacter sp. TaxID=66852 RepID=UPI0026DF72B0|nr:hypothetical protein [Methanobrevibacter sp.]MDO5860040.1 hypothetical protein [Methanobrevibacter sp.]
MIKNNIKRLGLLLIILSVICTISCVSAVDYDSNSSEIISDSAPVELSEIHVSADASDEMGDGSSQNPFKSLGYAINNSKNDSTIYLNDGVYGGDNNRNIKIDKSITIIGKSKENTIVNAESCGRLFNVTPTNRLTLINITLLNGNPNGDGGLIYCDCGEINIKNCIMMNSTGFKNGGVIYNNLGTLNIEDSSFINNTAFQYGGVMYTLGTTFIKNSKFTGNVVTSQSAVSACIAAGGRIDLEGCLFYECYSSYSAGALLNIGNATINNCRFERLSTNYTAGAISNHKYMVINNSYFGYNEVRYYAAAILAPPSGQHVITEVYNTIFEENHAGFHGAVSNNFKDTELYMQNCAIVNNYIKLGKLYGDISLDDNATVQYCWWGQNEINPYYYSPHSGEIAPEKINASRWLIMTFTSDNGVIYQNEVNQLTVSLRYYFDNETKEIYEYDGDFNLPLEVTFFTNGVTLAKKKLVNGVATFNYNPQNGNDAVYARIDNQLLKIDNFKLRETSKIVVNNLEKYYGSSSKLVIKLVDENNDPISNEQLNISLSGKVYAVKTDKNGQASLSTSSLAPNSYVAKITFAGNTNYIKSSAEVKVKVKKAIPKLSAVKKTFKKSTKTKSYAVVLKTNMNKALNNVLVTLKVNKKTYKVKTNKNGKATFKITNLKKRGSFTAVVKYSGNKYYASKTVKTKIIVK